MTRRRFDTVMLDVGGSEVVVLTGEAASTDNVARIINDITTKRMERLQAATEAQKRMHTQWMNGHHVYGRREVDGLRIWLDAPSYHDAEANERVQGATLHELDFFRAISRSGMIYGKHYSIKEPDGEPGSTHTADLIEVSYPEFFEATCSGWR